MDLSFINVGSLNFWLYARKRKKEKINLCCLTVSGKDLLFSKILFPHHFTNSYLRDINLIDPSIGSRRWNHTPWVSINVKLIQFLWPPRMLYHTNFTLIYVPILILTVYRLRTINNINSNNFSSGKHFNPSPKVILSSSFLKMNKDLLPFLLRRH